MSSVRAAEVGAQVYALGSEPLETALHDVALRTGQTVLAPSRLLAGKRSAPLNGRYTSEQAIRALLAGSTLTLERVGSAWVVRGPQDAGPAAAAAPGDTGLSEVVVTASHIHDAPPTAPIRTVTRLDIQRSGFADVGDMARSLPESFSGGQNPGVLSGATSANPANQNQSNASTLNLRGLGSDATLVLLDGHRMSADGEFEGVDVSVIPLSAVERVDIVTDGASALYGSDAVAGVANFIMRSDYSGAELTQRIGGTTDGGGLQQVYSGLAGAVWGGGHALASVEYRRQDPILADQRAITSGAPPRNPLIQAESQTDVFVNLGQDLAPWASFHLDGLYATRATGASSQRTLGGATYTTHTAVQSYFVAPSLKLALPAQWAASLDGVISTSRDGDVFFNPGSISHFVNANSSNSVELTANGPAVSLPSGMVKLAIGGGYRWESYLANQTPGSRQAGQRTVAYAYGEVFAPLVRPSPARTGLEALDLSLAGRVERYSDFGSTANPKIGLRYEPLDGIIIRGDWGTSFKAPEFLQTTFPGNIFYYPAAALGGAGGQALLTYGGNPNLKPERSRSWTLGADWRPPALPGLQVSATYFHIDFTGRIVQPISGVGAALANPVYAPFVTANPTSAEQAAAIANAARFYNFVGAAYDPSSVVALIDDLFTNASTQTIDGVDLSIKKRFALGRDELDAAFDGSWLRIRQKTIATAPVTTLTGTLFNPPTLRLRSGVTWIHGPLSATAMVNYIAGETDTGVTPNAPVAPWTTVDLNIAYTLAHTARFGSNLQIAVSVTNLFDQPPPFARGAAVGAPGFNFDSANTSAIGRFVALTLRERL